jgi:hypothetical protein
VRCIRAAHGAVEARNHGTFGPVWRPPPARRSRCEAMSRPRCEEGSPCCSADCPGLAKTRGGFRPWVTELFQPVSRPDLWAIGGRLPPALSPKRNRALTLSPGKSMSAGPGNGACLRARIAASSRELATRLQRPARRSSAEAEATNTASNCPAPAPPTPSRASAAATPRGRRARCPPPGSPSPRG